LAIIENGVKKACHTCYWGDYGAVPACAPWRCTRYSNWEPTEEKKVESEEKKVESVEPKGL
jgi:hypothetical protein